MKGKFFIALALAAALHTGFVTVAGADEVHRRITAARESIERGVQNKTLNRGEADRLYRELDRVRDDEARMKANGSLNYSERERLDRELDRLENDISRMKSNDNTANPGGIKGRISRAKEQIASGENAGNLTPGEANRLRRDLDRIQDEDGRMRANGSLSPSERSSLNHELDRLEDHIRNLKRNDNRRY